MLPADAAWAAGPWLRVRRAADGRDIPLPADLCLRRPVSRRAFDPPWPLSIGCAAGPTAEAAALHGLLELIERDAAALWWRGGQRGRPVAIEEPASQEAAALIAALRQGGRSPRRSWLLDITTDLGVPVVAAVSFGPAGDGFCCGLAARPTLRAAARAAVPETAQMELAHAVVQAKRRERGDAALNPADRAHLRRFAGIDAGRCALVHPLGPCRAAAGADLPAASAAEALRAVRGRIAAAGLEEVLTLDLTRTAFGIPVVRTLCPGLEVEPSRLAGPRLRAAVARTGGGGCQPGGIELM